MIMNQGRFVLWHSRTSLAHWHVNRMYDRLADLVKVQIHTCFSGLTKNRVTFYSVFYNLVSPFRYRQYEWLREFWAIVLVHHTHESALGLILRRKMTSTENERSKYAIEKTKSSGRYGGGKKPSFGPVEFPSWRSAAAHAPPPQTVMASWISRGRKKKNPFCFRRGLEIRERSRPFANGRCKAGGAIIQVYYIVSRFQTHKTAIPAR